MGFYKGILEIADPNLLGAAAPGSLARVTLATVYSEKKRIKPGEVTVISALLESQNEAKTSFKVYFYDGDPQAGGQLISKETTTIEGNSLTEVSIPYYAPSDGIHRIFAVINKGKPNECERHTSAIIVGQRRHDRYDSASDGDDPPPGRRRPGKGGKS